MSKSDRQTIILLYASGGMWICLNSLGYNHITLCPAMRILHVPCLSCGLTRAFFSLINGDVIQSLAYNANAIILTPLIVFIPVVFVYDHIFNGNMTNYTFNILYSILKNKIFISFFAIFEAFVWLVNIIRECLHNNLL